MKSRGWRGILPRNPLPSLPDDVLIVESEIELFSEWQTSDSIYFYGGGGGGGEGGGVNCVSLYDKYSDFGGPKNEGFAYPGRYRLRYLTGCDLLQGREKKLANKSALSTIIPIHPPSTVLLCLA